MAAPNSKGKGPSFKDPQAPGGRKNPFGATKPKPVVKPVTGKPAKKG